MDKKLQKRQVIANLVVSLVGLCLTLVTIELVLRSVIPLHPRRPPEFRVPHPVLGWTLEAGASYIYAMPEDTVTVTYNSQGWRDLEHDISKPDDVFRILILGDSFMEAYSVDLSDSFHQRVEELTRAAGGHTEVINMGVAGYGTLQEYLMFQDKGQLYAPDLVLLGFFTANDVMNNSNELESMLGPERAQRLARPFLDPTEPSVWMVIPGDFKGAQRRYEEQRAILDAQRSSLTERIILLRMVRQAIRKIADEGSAAKNENSRELFAKEAQELAVLGVNYCVEPVAYTRAWDTTERILSRLKADVEAIGAQLVVFTVPALEEVSLKSYEAIYNSIAYADKLCIEEAPGHTRLSQILTELDIELITLLPDFRRVMRDEGILLYRLSDQHWNPEGHALAAERVVSELVERQLIPTEH